MAKVGWGQKSSQNNWQSCVVALRFCSHGLVCTLRTDTPSHELALLEDWCVEMLLSDLGAAAAEPDDSEYSYLGSCAAWESKELDFNCFHIWIWVKENEYGKIFQFPDFILYSIV
ncbi:hypothetical protein XENORESO_016929 [Xenotaenia resolanae]|uniref:Uncharacterized protein n=1 Tax=Xenotaenia resolanae TaxID=208358 RepID=A0ABV0X638_9TELE